MRLGFIGTGAIAEAVITGMLTSKSFGGTVLVSQRNEARSSKLASRFDQVVIAADNQSLVDESECVFVSVLPEQAEAVLSGLRFREGQLVVSMVAGRTLESLSSLVAPATEVFRIIPLPPIELGLGPMPITPPHAELEKLFSGFSTPIPVDDEDQFSAFSAQSAVMASFFEFAASQARWIEKQGVSRTAAATYATSTLRALAEMTCHATSEQLQGMADECLTAGGLNEQVLHEGREDGWFDRFNERLDRIADRLGAAKTDGPV